MSRRRARRVALLAVAMLAVLPVVAARAVEPTADAVTLDRVQVTSARLQSVPAFDVPASLSVVTLDGTAARPGVSVSEALDGVPGLAARERQNFAQDTQLSIRGFGARSTFGVRGLRLYADGIPATMPDGQGQVSHFSLAGAERIEVLRGPFSALHGNSSGGVVQIWSADGVDPTQGHVQASAGRDDSRVLSASVRGAGDMLGGALAASRFETDGWRDHSAARRTSLNAKLHAALPGGGRVQLVGNHFDAPDAQDPLGLTAEQVRADPRQATAVALQYGTRKSARQDQLGLRLEQPLGGGHALEAMAYAGRREIEQFLSVPVGAQSNPLSSGGVIDLDNDYGGLDLRWRWAGSLAGRTLEFTAGANADRQRQHRRGYENFVGDALGVRGALRRDERNRVENVDRYAQAWWQFAPRWSLLAGVRHSQVRFRSRDGYVSADNPDDSGRVDYAETTPVLGLTFAPHADWRLYVSAGRGFETPTFNELGYRADGGAGLAFDLAPATSTNVELGTKWRTAGGVQIEAALFRADTDDELAVARNVGGRSSYRNVGRARREGAEIAAVLPFGADWSLAIAATWLDARFRDTFPICTGAGCTDPSVQVPAGASIPGTTRRQASARLQWEPGDWRLALEAVAVDRIGVNDTGSEQAPGHAIANAEAARSWNTARGRWRAFARVDNVFDHAHIGSVIVNEGNGRYYEPAPGRGLLLGLRWDWQSGMD
ncbi:TonB-dependent receptor family protein [Luteimonas kalidii]|uniref:TonB-dependent receptor n=1 Tax=Luteimonas kalidii TaxID=3042025 RepID=A0ABT6JNR2_9GAMM|nr:TonB-dependent receptor [Luteimonas kalidii]MDH5832324.1 TonB-dependent receptor [Luteimonas kalidii]